MMSGPIFFSRMSDLPSDNSRDPFETSRAAAASLNDLPPA